jgi:urocanate hydratase
LLFDSPLSSAVSFTLRVHNYYTNLISFAEPVSGSDQEPSLGGNLLYVGELDAEGRALTAAGNIAGASSLTATSDFVSQKQAIREGVVDFLVTSLDEALRILKNEIRKRNTVAVCVAGSPAEIEREMLERGVQPDLQRPRLIEEVHHPESRAEATGVSESQPKRAHALISWTALSAPGRWLPKLDEVALGCVETDDWAARRWLRLAPRYIGRTSSGVRMLLADDGFASRFVDQVRGRVQSGEIGSEVQIQISIGDRVESHRYIPAHLEQRT